MAKVTYDELRELLHYDPATGVFTNKTTRGPRAFAGSVAGKFDTHGYRQIQIQGKNYLSSRLAWYYQEGYWPELQIDHINRVRSDDRWCNLRHVSAQCNTRNCKKRSTNKSGITGVYFEKSCKKWRATICKFTSNSLPSFLDAVKLRWKLEKEYKFNNCQTTSQAFLYLKEKGMI